MAGCATPALPVRWSEPHLTLRAHGTAAFAGPAGQSRADLIVAGTRHLTRGISLALGNRWARETVRADTASSFGM